MRAVVILNATAPGARRFRQAWPTIRDRYAVAGWSTEVWETCYPGHAIHLARTAVATGAGLVLGVGGDGTIHEILNGLVGTDTVFGVIPGGTGNIWARQIGLPLEPAAAAMALLRGTVREIDLGWALDRYFFMMAGVGFDGYVMRSVTPSIKRGLRIGAYILAGVLTGLRFRSTVATLTIDGVRRSVEEFHLAVAGNTRHYAFVDITNRAFADDGLLDLCTFSGHPPFLRRLLHLANILFARHVGTPGVSYDRAKEIVIETREPMPIQMDGEPIGSTPAVIRIAPHAVRVLMPKRHYNFLARPPLHLPGFEGSR